jgi:acetylornithine deacetylase
MDAVVDTLAKLVAFPTVSDRPTTAIAAYLAERAEAAGFLVELFESSADKANVVASRGPRDTDGLVLSGHMDVVPVEGQAWTSDPFRLTERGDNLHARGACDMKGFLAAASEAVDRLPALTRELVLVWTHDEEIGCRGSARLVETLSAKGRRLPSLTWIGEPTSMQVARMHAGHTTVRLVLTGRPAHSSRPELGANAIRALGRVLAELEAFGAELARDRRYEDLLANPFTLVNPAVVEGGAAVNIVPEHAQLDVGIRCVPGVDSRRVVEALRARVATLDLGGVGVSVEVLQETQALLTRSGTELEALLLPHAHDPRMGAVPFATDGGNLARLGTEPLVFGPGSIDVAHRPDEFIPRGELSSSVDVIEQVVHARCVVPPERGGVESWSGPTV